MFFELGKMSSHGHGQQVRHRFQNDPGKSLKVRFIQLVFVKMAVRFVKNADKLFLKMVDKTVSQL